MLNLSKFINVYVYLGFTYFKAINNYYNWIFFLGLFDMRNSKENSPDIVEQSKINYDEENCEHYTGKLDYIYIYINRYQ